MDKAKEEEEKIVELDTTTYLNAEGDLKLKIFVLADVVTGAAGLLPFSTSLDTPLLHSATCWATTKFS
ncbi:MAG: hypothetical protein R3C26_03950 [Calditrichia bacterium]